MSNSSQTLIVDCDGVIADKSSLGDYGNAEPLPFGIEQVNKLYDMGYIIVLYTARYGDRESGNIHKQYERGYREWTDWLEKYGVKYHHAFMGKPAGAIYIDDKAARVEADSQDGWGQVWKEVNNLEGKDKYGNPPGWAT
jgi:histidinol phosphatase-like enzyme